MVILCIPALGVYAKNLTESVCTSEEEILKLMEFGVKKRSVAATNMNATSSRSHAVFSIKVEVRGSKEK